MLHNGSKGIGIQIIGDLKSCDKSILKKLKQDVFREYLNAVITKHQLTCVGYTGHDFDIGFTAVAALAESHIAVHTWPDEGYVSIDIHVCNYSKDHSDTAQNIFGELCAYFCSQDAQMQIVHRSMESHE